MNSKQIITSDHIRIALFDERGKPLQCVSRIPSTLFGSTMSNSSQPVLYEIAMLMM